MFRKKRCIRHLLYEQVKAIINKYCAKVKAENGIIYTIIKAIKDDIAAIIKAIK
ncbi:MAG: hypothetical protein ACYCXQ_05900 [Candidatus Humimicrobiaceae bacterium]